jgi:hypothetical protein
MIQNYLPIMNFKLVYKKDFIDNFFILKANLDHHFKNDHSPKDINFTNSRYPIN